MSRFLYVMAGAEPTEAELRTIAALESEGHDVETQAYDEFFGTDHLVGDFSGVRIPHDGGDDG